MVSVTSGKRRTADGNVSMLEPHVLEYRPNETARLTTDPVLQRDARRVSIRALAKEAGVSDKTVKAARKGERLRKSTIEKLSTAIRKLVLEDNGGTGSNKID
jgi:hypothetical protein